MRQTPVPYREQLTKDNTLLQMMQKERAERKIKMNQMSVSHQTGTISTADQTQPHFSARSMSQSTNLHNRHFSIPSQFSEQSVPVHDPESIKLQCGHTFDREVLKEEIVGVCGHKFPKNVITWQPKSKKYTLPFCPKAFCATQLPLQVILAAFPNKKEESRAELRFKWTLAQKLNRGMVCQLCDSQLTCLEDGVFYSKCENHVFHLNCVLDKSYGSAKWNQKSQQTRKMKKDNYTTNFECAYCGKKRDKITEEILKELKIKQSNCLIF